MTGFNSKKQMAANDYIASILACQDMLDQQPVPEGSFSNFVELFPQAVEELVKEQNFCPRCGKRTPDLTTIHTCTPPQ